MSAAQRQSRRKTVRQFFDDDDEPPAKRSKVEAAAVTSTAGKQASGKSSVAKPKKARTAYDEDADGFTFSRKTRSKKSSDEPVPVSEPQPSSSKPRVVAKTKRNDSKTDSLLASTSSETDPTHPRRRSARLSGDKEEIVQILPTEKPKRKRKSNELKSAEVDREGSPQLVQQELQVDKKRDGMKIALPFADTPVINRNKEMRAAKGKPQNRRSSVTSRGRRASSLIESGTSNAVPHADVEINDFYKHIEQSLIEPKRMRQLLTWSATRALPEKIQGGNGDANTIFILEAARSIIEDLLKDFSNKPEMSDWFSREDTAQPTSIVKKPNPRNSQNAERLQKLEEDIARLKDEEKQWNDLMKTPKIGKTNDLDDIDLSALDPEQAAILAELRPESEGASKTKKRRKSKAKEEAQIGEFADVAARVQAINASLEPQIDLFADGIHKIGQYRLAAERVADAILSTTARKLEIREKDAQKVTGTTAVGAKEVLSALAGALNGRNDGR